MKTIFLALALFTTAAHAAQDPDRNPCDGVDEDKQTLACSVYSRNTAEQLLEENFKHLEELVNTQFGANLSQAKDLINKLQAGRQAWEKLRDADCAVEVFPSAAGSQAYTIAMNDCIAHTSDERSGYLESVLQE